MKKPWGQTERVYVDDTIQVDRIRVVPGGHSSVHLHLGKSNLFIVHEGTLRVLVWREHRRMEYVLQPSTNSSVTVERNVRHQFWAVNHVLATEVYAADPGQLDVEDIVRFSENGVRSEPSLI